MQGIIIGAGIGGLATAIALQQRGINVHVYEQADEIREVGAGLVMAANAMQVLDWLGLAETVQQKGWPLHRALIIRSNGIPVQTVDVDALAQQYGFGMTVINRGQLQKTLLATLPSNCVRTAKRLTDLCDDGQRVRATFADGSVVEGDFLIGADGIRSAVRRQLMDDQPLRYSRQTCWRTIIDYPLLADVQNTSFEYWGLEAGLRVGLVPLSANQVYTYVTAKAPAGQRDEPGQVLPTLRNLAKPLGTAVTNILERIDESRVFRADLYDLLTLPSWSRGRVTLLGDAAHATTPNLGQGACQAIEDAWAVATCLSQYEPAQAFAHYELLRKRKADRVVQVSRQIGTAVNMPSWLKPLIFAAMRAIPKLVAERQFAEIYDVTYLKEAKNFTAFQSHPAPAESRLPAA